MVVIQYLVALSLAAQAVGRGVRKDVRMWGGSGRMPGGGGGMWPVGGGSTSITGSGGMPGDNGGMWPGVGGSTSMPGSGGMPGRDGGMWPGGGGSTSMPGSGGMPGGDGGMWPDGADSTSMPGSGGMPGGDGGMWPGGGGSTSMPGSGGMPGGDGGMWPGGADSTSMPGSGGMPGGDEGMWPGGGGSTSMPGSGEAPGGGGGMWPGEGGFTSMRGSGGMSGYGGGMWPAVDGSASMPDGGGVWPGADGTTSMPGTRGMWPPMYPPISGGGGGGMPGGGDMPSGGGWGGWFPPMFTTPSKTTTPSPSCSSLGGQCVTTPSECSEDSEFHEGYSCVTGTCCLPSVLPDSTCGIKPLQSRIVGGNEATPHSHPWQVSLQTSGGSHFCGGSLINDLWVITAAHCINDGVGRVVLGEHNHDISHGPEVIRGSSLIIPHEDYSNGGSYPNDIALVKLDAPVQFSGEVSPACVPKPGQDFSNEEECWISGWGDTRNTGDETMLNELRVGITDNPTCASKWGFQDIMDTHICVGDGDVGACNGDSGGPLSCKKGDKWMLAGATSWGYSGCQTAGKPNVYTRVSEYRQWIIDNIRSN